MRNFALPWLLLALALAGTPGIKALAADESGRVTVLQDDRLPARALARIGADEFRAQNRLGQLAFSPDGKVIAAVEVGAGFPTLVLFEVGTGRPVKYLAVPDARQQGTSRIAFSPDGKGLLWGERNGYVALWDLVHDRLVYREKLHEAEIADVAFSPDGKLVAACSMDGWLRLWQVDTPSEPLRTLMLVDPNRKGATDQFLSIAGHVLAFMPAGDQLVIAGKKDGQISVWDLASGEFQHRVDCAHGHGRAENSASLNHIAIVPGGRLIMSAGQETVPREKTKVERGGPTVPLSQVRFWDLQTGERRAIELGGDDYGMGYAALAPDGKQVAVADVGRLTFWDATTGKRIRSLTVPGWMGSPPVYSPDGTVVAVAIDNAVALFDAATGRRLHHEAQTPIGAVRLCAWAPTGDRIVTVHSHDGICRVWQAETGKLIWSYEIAPATVPGDFNSYPALAAFSADGASVVIAGGKNDRRGSLKGVIVVCDSQTGATQREIELEIIVSTAALAPDGKTLVVVEPGGRRGNECRLHAFDLASGRHLFVAPPADQPAGLGNIISVMIRPESPIVLAVTAGGEVLQFDKADGRQTRTIRAEKQKPDGRRQETLLSCAFSDDGQMLATCTARRLLAWDVDTGEVRFQAEHHYQAGCHLCLSPNKKLLAISDRAPLDDRGAQIRLYDLDAGHEFLQLEPGANRTRAMSFSSDGKHLFTGFHRGAGMVWDVGR